MKNTHSIIFQAFLFISTVIPCTLRSQLNVNNLQVCHNQEGKLVCINDGDFLFRFINGDFSELQDSDLQFKYSNQSRTITFIRKEFKPTEYFDTIYISLLQKSILLKRGKELLEIDSIVKLKEVLFGFGVGSISENGTIKGLAFSIEDKVVKAEISTFHDRWAWDIRIEEKTKTILIEYNEFKDNRLSHIYVRDENLRSGFVVSTSLRTLKKIETVESLYSDTIKINNTTVRTNVIAPNQRFYFSYKKSGSLKSIQGKGEMKLCDCTTQF